MSDNVAIKVENVHKDFQLPHLRPNSIKATLLQKLLKKGSSTDEVQHALKGITLEVKKGEFFGIAGRNGSGKSTLLKILAGIYQPTKGHIQVNGKLVPFIELGVGFNPELTGRENVYLNGAILGFSEEEVDDMYDSIVEFSELERFMDQKLKNYSSGMQVRLAFSVAIRANSDILLIDEVLAVGDVAFQRKCFSFFRELKKNKRTVVFVTHDMDAIRQFCDRAAFVDNSKLVMVDDAQKIADAYTKMFIQEALKAAKVAEASTTIKKENVNRQGDGAVKYRNVRHTTTADKILLKAEADILKNVKDPVFGFLIKNFAEQTLFGTNTQKQRIKLDKLTAGQKIIITWNIPNILNDGKYGVDFSVSYQQGISADWWENATEIDVIQEVNNPFLVNPPAQFRIDRLDK